MHAPLDRIVAHIEGAALDERSVATLRERLDDVIAKTGVPLTRPELATIDRFHRRFIESGVGLRFQSTGRPPQSHYPTYRDLLLATDSLGERSNYLASEEAYQFVRSLEQKDLVIPVVGDLSGSRALSAIGSHVRQRGQRLSAFYASNVEFYLFGDGRFERFVANLNAIPRAENGVIIRSVFGRYASYGSSSSSHLQATDDLVSRIRQGPLPLLRRPPRRALNAAGGGCRSCEAGNHASGGSTRRHGVREDDTKNDRSASREDRKSAKSCHVSRAGRHDTTSTMVNLSASLVGAGQTDCWHRAMRQLGHSA